MTITGIKDAAELYNYVSQSSRNGGASFADAVKDAEAAAEKNNGSFEMKSDEEILTETLYEIYKSKQQNDAEKEENKKDFWEIRDKRQEILDEYFERMRLQREAFEKLALKRQQAREYFFDGKGVLFLNSAARDIFSHMSMF